MAVRPPPPPLRRRPRAAAPVRQPMPKSAYGPPKTVGNDNLWRWVGWTALAHVIVLLILLVVGFFKPAPPKEQQWIDLMPSGSLTHGVPAGTTASQPAHASVSHPSVQPHRHTAPPVEEAAETPRPSHPLIHPPTPAPHHTAQSPVPVAIETPQPTPHHKHHVIEEPSHETPVPVATTAPVHHSPTPHPVKTPPPVELQEVTRVVPAAPETVQEPAHHVTETPHPTEHHHHTPSPEPRHTAEEQPTEPSPEAPSPEEITRVLQQHLSNSTAGVAQATHSGPSGVANGHASDFGSFYASIRDQVYDAWQAPGVADGRVVSPIVQIHVEPDGRVPSEQVLLIRSSGNSDYDASALNAARNLGQLRQSLPPGCPPDIKVTFDPAH